jgi:hypothetical protein
VKDGIQGSRAQTIAVSGQLLHHAETENRFLLGMMKDVEANEAGIQVSVIVGGHGSHNAHIEYTDPGRGFPKPTLDATMDL